MRGVRAVAPSHIRWATPGRPARGYDGDAGRRFPHRGGASGYYMLPGGFSRAEGLGGELRTRRPLRPAADGARGPDLLNGFYTVTGMAAASRPQLLALALVFLAASCTVLPGAGVSTSGDSAAAPDELVVSADGRYLTHRDGRPFLWVGDTAWGIFGRLTRPEITEYLTARAEQGFTVIQMVTVFPTWDGVNAEDRKSVV